MIKELTKSDSLIKVLTILETENFGGEAWDKEMIRQMFDAKYITVYGLYENEELIGYGVLACVYEQGDIQNIVVANGFKGKGNGKKLLSYMTEEAVKKGVKTLFLEVNTENTVAINMYQNAGFEIVGKRRNYYEDSNYNSNDAYQMVKQI